VLFRSAEEQGHEFRIVHRRGAVDNGTGNLDMSRCKRGVKFLTIGEPGRQRGAKLVLDRANEPIQQGAGGEPVAFAQPQRLGQEQILDRNRTAPSRRTEQPRGVITFRSARRQIGHGLS
jgi:hypothetical protein